MLLPNASQLHICASVRTVWIPDDLNMFKLANLLALASCFSDCQVPLIGYRNGSEVSDIAQKLTVRSRLKVSSSRGAA